MKRFRIAPIALAMLAMFSTSTINSAIFAQSNGGADKPQPPMIEKKTKTTKIHNDTMVDDYFWLREKTNPVVISHLEAENTYSDAMMKPTAELQEKLYKEMVGHIKETDETVPYRFGDYYYFSRTEQGKQYSIHKRKKGSPTGPEEVLLDLNEMAKGSEVFEHRHACAERRWKPAGLLD